MGAISNIGEVIAGKSETENSLSTIISNTSNTINAQENETSCNNTINEVDVNLIEIDGGECKTNYARGLVEMGVSPDKKLELSATLNTDANITGFSQDIKGKAEQSCNITATSNAFQGQGSSIDQAAIQSALSDIEGAGTISTNTDSCNAIDNTQNACSYIKSTLCCNAVTNAMKKYFRYWMCLMLILKIQDNLLIQAVFKVVIYLIHKKVNKNKLQK